MTGAPGESSDIRNPDDSTTSFLTSALGLSAASPPAAHTPQTTAVPKNFFHFRNDLAIMMHLGHMSLNRGQVGQSGVKNVICVTKVSAAKSGKG
jgi:hypothetical protein